LIGAAVRIGPARDHHAVSAATPSELPLIAWRAAT
jgi:hypothetical protein